MCGFLCASLPRDFGLSLCGQQIPGRPSLAFPDAEEPLRAPARATSQLDSSMGFRVLQRHHLERASLKSWRRIANAGSQVSQFLLIFQLRAQ